MTQRDDLDLMLSRWVDDPYALPAPSYLTQVLERTRRTRQRPAWTYPGRWLPMADKIAQPVAAVPPRLAWLVLIALLLAALIGAAVVGSQLIKKTPAPIPVGGSAVFTFSSFIGTDNGQTGGDIYIARADGSDRRQLTADPGIALTPAFSPDGTRIAYERLDRGTAEVRVMDAGGGSEATLASSPAVNQDCVRWGLSWSPDGRSLIYPANPACSPFHQLFIVAADGSSEAHDLLAKGTSGILASWSPSGTKVAFIGSEGDGSAGLYVADLGPDGGLSGGLHAHRIGPDVGAGLDEVVGTPRWSPDGTELAVTVVKHGFFITEAEGIYVVKADGSGQRLIATRAGNPAWSPDGRQIAYQRTVDPSEYWNERPCTVRMWIVDADGTDERRLDPLADGCEGPVLWSPDGSRLTATLIASTPEKPALDFHVGVVTIDGSSPVVILQDGMPSAWQPVAAPLPAAPSFAAGSAAP